MHLWGRHVQRTRSFEGGGTGRRFDGWRTPNTSANAASQMTLSRLRSRCRALTRDDEWAGKAIRVITSNVIGTGIRPYFRGANKAQVQNVKDRWRVWAESTDCDAQGMTSFYGLQAHAMRSMVEGGEALFRQAWSRRGTPTLKIQLLEPDHLDTDKNELLKRGHRIVQGVEFDSRLKRVAYWIFPEHPGEQWPIRNLGIESKRVPADLIHTTFRTERIGQVRGVPWGAPCVLRLRDLNVYEDAQLVREQIAACFAAFVRDPLGAPTPSSDADLIDSMEPGMVEHLAPGQEISFAIPPTPSPGDFVGGQLRRVAAGYGVPYESLTGDLRGVNFSSGRMGWIEFHRAIQEWRWMSFIPQFCATAWSWFRLALELQGVDTEGVFVTWRPAASGDD